MSDSNAEGATRGREVKQLVLRIVLGGLAMAVLTGISKAMVARWDLPFLLRPLLVISQVVPLLVILWKPIVPRKSDELDQRIGMEMLAFAFCGLFVVFLTVGLLHDGGLLPNFAWKTEYLLGAMGGLVVLGYGWARRRYR